MVILFEASLDLGLSYTLLESDVRDGNLSDSVRLEKCRYNGRSKHVRYCTYTTENRRIKGKGGHITPGLLTVKKKSAFFPLIYQIKLFIVDLWYQL